MTLASPPDQLADPLAAFYAQDPTVLEQGTPIPPVSIATRPHDRIAWEIAAAVLVAGTVIRHHLAAQAPQVGQTQAQAKSAWAVFAPTWLRLTAPAVKQAYLLGRVDGLTDDELTALASDYAQGIGEYLNQSSAAALEEGFNAQLAQRWSPQLAWYRASAAYGLDSRDMKAYLRAAVTDKSVDPIPAIAKTLVDKAFLARAERLGVEESYSATQSGQAISWLWLERNGRIPLGSTREWELGVTERHCATCAELALQEVSLDQPFVLKSGAKIWAPRAHPGCLCRVKRNPPRIELGKAMPRAAGIALVAADTGRVLMLQRAHDESDPAGGTWEFPGGCAERGEAPFAAGVREWQEEVRRKLPPLLRPLGVWTCGAYAGFALEVASESSVPSHSRGRVANPDDPDGDAVEAIAWWDPKHLVAGNPALRKELRSSLGLVRQAIAGQPLAKADWHSEPRDRQGQWAKVAERETQTREQTPAKPSSPFDAPARSPFDAGNPFDLVGRFDAATRFQAPSADSRFSAFDSPFHRPRPQPLERRVTIIGLPSRPSPQAAEPYVMAVDDFHLVAGRAALGAHYGLSGLVDFNRAEKPPVASSEISVWDALDDDLVLVPLIPPHMKKVELEWNWDQLQAAARLGYNAAFTEAGDDVDPIVAKLTGPDLSRVYRLAGYEDERDGSEEHDNRLRQKIKLAVQHHGQGSPHIDALAEAYADYATFAQPVRLLGRQTGQPIEDALNECERAGMEVRNLADPPVPVQQVFSFSEGFHPHTQVDPHEAQLVSQYSPFLMEYHSAMAHYGAGEVPPMRFGLQVLYMMPMVHAKGVEDSWVPLGNQRG